MKYHEGFLAQIIIYSLIWLYDDYVGLVFSLIMCSILLALLIFAYMVEFIEKSKVPKSFYRWMLISIIPPILVSLLFFIITGGNFDWIDQFG